MPVELVVFDLGGVLIKLAGSWQRACHAAGVELPDALRDPQVVGQCSPFVEANESGQIDCDEFDRRIAELVSLPAETVRRISTAWLIEPHRDIDAMLDELHATRVATACLSNTNAHHWSLMTGRGNVASLPLDRLHFRFASHLLRLRKPADEIYEHVERETNVPAPHIVFFDDSDENVEAALRRGWRAVRIDARADTVPQMRCHLHECGVL